MSDLYQTCTKCQKRLLLECFYFRTSGKRESWCRFCKSRQATETRRIRRQTDSVVRQRDYAAAQRWNSVQESDSPRKNKQRAYSKKHRATPRARINKSNWRKLRRKNDPTFRMVSNIRAATWNAIKGFYKSASTEKLLGCSFEHLKVWLTFWFRPGMSWANYGKVWEIDHRRPIASFDLSKEKEQKECFHYTNLQPLFSQENWTKKDKWNPNE